MPYYFQPSAEGLEGPQESVLLNLCLRAGEFGAHGWQEAQELIDTFSSSPVFHGHPFYWVVLIISRVGLSISVPIANVSPLWKHSQACAEVPFTRYRHLLVQPSWPTRPNIMVSL